MWAKASIQISVFLFVKLALPIKWNINDKSYHNMPCFLASLITHVGCSNIVVEY